jgi:hypothetical protein
MTPSVFVVVATQCTCAPGMLGVVRAALLRCQHGRRRRPVRFDFFGSSFGSGQTDLDPATNRS